MSAVSDTGDTMFELWVVTEGCGKGELLLVDVGAEEDLPPQLRRRVRRVGPGRFTTEAEATQFRRAYRSGRFQVTGLDRCAAS
jgi:hypothetical protein